ncbi:MFS transporter [Rappaport israeli]|uniref:MFS transporter n=1 Tax=Rappaport israeli TaxID=1839807 RepID=UPI0009313524|nr:MFS transporter [Rappaport israeli]
MPSIRHPYWVIFFLALGACAIGTSEFATMTLLPQMALDLHINEARAGHLISAYAFGVVIGAPTLALALASWTRQRALSFLISAFAFCHLLALFAPNYLTMLTIRFLSALPHGAYLGIAALFAGHLLGKAHRGKAIALVFLGLNLAALLGAPLTNWLGQHLSWRITLALAALLAGISAAALILLVPKSYQQQKSHPWQELNALKNKQVWLTLSSGAIGFGGLFAIYTYLASMLTQQTQIQSAYLPLYFTFFGIGMTLGGFLTGLLADRNLKATVIGIFLWCIVWEGSLNTIIDSPRLMLLWSFTIGLSSGLGTALQVRLMDIAAKAQIMAATLNHAAFNIANALGPLLASLLIASGYSFSSSGYLGAILAAIGLLIWCIALYLESRSTP